MFFLCLNVLHNRIQLARTNRKRGIAALPKESAISGINRLHPFRGCLLNVLDESRGRHGAWKRCDNVNVICNSTNYRNLGSEIATYRGEICVHFGPNVFVQPGLALLCAEHNVKDDLAQRLWHGIIMTESSSELNRAFSAFSLVADIPGALPQAGIEAAPLARVPPKQFSCPVQTRLSALQLPSRLRRRTRVSDLS